MGQRLMLDGVKNTLLSKLLLGRKEFIQTKCRDGWLPPLTHRAETTYDKTYYDDLGILLSKLLAYNISNYNYNNNIIQSMFDFSLDVTKRYFEENGFSFKETETAGHGLGIFPPPPLQQQQQQPSDTFQSFHVEDKWRKWCRMC